MEHIYKRYIIKNEKTFRDCGSGHEEKRDRLKKQIEYASENQDIFQDLKNFPSKNRDGT